MSICSSLSIPEVTELQVWKALEGVKRTATGPNAIPYWGWRDDAEIPTGVVTKLWNLSLSSHSWPKSWKRANINPLSKIDVGINVTPVIARVFEKVVHCFHAKGSFENSLAPSQFAYRDGGSCTNALFTIQHRVLSFLDNPACKGVRLFSKAFDMVKYVLLAGMISLKVLISTLIFRIELVLSDRQQRVLYNNSFVGKWKDVNRGTTQGSESGPYLFTVFLNDLNTQLKGVDIFFKYADDTNIVIPLWKDGVDQSLEVVDSFLRWSEKNSMSCNPRKCKELTLRKKEFVEQLCKIHDIPQCSELKLD